MTVAWTRVVAVEGVKSNSNPGCILKRKRTEFANQLDMA